MRPARVDDAAAMAAVHYHSWVVGYEGLIPREAIVPLGEGRVRRWEHIIERAGTNVLVAEREASVVGFATTSPSEPTLVELQTMYVHPDHWRTGVGRELMEYLVDDWSQSGVRRVFLFVLETNEGARRFYEAFGWRNVGESRTVAMGGVDLPVVRYELEAGSFTAGKG